MEYLLLQTFSALPITLLIFMGAQYGMAERFNQKLPTKETFSIFLTLWLLATILRTAFHLFTPHLIPSGFDANDQLLIETLGPVVIGIVAGRSIVESRHNANAKKVKA